ncbi:MAG: NADH-quinone oxidoreductase subunit C [Dehalococcoidales bacterium]|nr:NADH-quinone oxidoreductase subunit C [Dehalococcoidales bacterium]
MTLVLPVQEIAPRLEEKFPGCIAEPDENIIIVKGEFLFEIASFLKNTPALGFDYLSYITAVDYQSHFDVIYYLISLEHNHSLTLKARCATRENPVVPSVVSLWKGADFQEREVYDLMGVNFEGHSNLKRIFLWDGFHGHPLRKDFKHQ